MQKEYRYATKSISSNFTVLCIVTSAWEQQNLNIETKDGNMLSVLQQKFSSFGVTDVFCFKQNIYIIKVTTEIFSWSTSSSKQKGKQRFSEYRYVIGKTLQLIYDKMSKHRCRLRFVLTTVHSALHNTYLINASRQDEIWQQHTRRSVCSLR